MLVFMLVFSRSFSQVALSLSPTTLIRNLEAGKKQTVVTFGTSLTAGGAWVGLMDAYLKDRYPNLATVYNEGASGHSSKYALTIVGNVTRHNPDAVLIEFAMNDAYYPEQNGFKEGVPVDVSKANLRALIDSIRKVSPACEVILQTMDLPLGIHLKRRPDIAAYYEGYRSVAVADGYALVDNERNWKAILDFDTSLYVSWAPDSIHPSAAGSGAITFPEVLSVLTGAKVGFSPALQAIYTPGADIEIKVAVTGPSARPARPLRVEFYQGKTKLGVDTTAPFSYIWKGAANGKYLVRAVLVQQETAVATTPGVPIQVKVSTAMARMGRESRYPGIAFPGNPSGFRVDGRIGGWKADSETGHRMAGPGPRTRRKRPSIAVSQQ